MSDTKRGISRCLLAIIFLGLVLRLIKLGNASLWFDEVCNLYISINARIADFVNYGQFSTHFAIWPLYLLRIWSFISKEEYFLRLLPVISGVLSIYILFKLSSLLFIEDRIGKKTALYSALLLAISPVHIHYSRELTFYSGFVLLSLASIYFFLRAIKSNLNYNWVGYVLVSILCIYLHSFGIFIIAIELLWYFIRKRGQALKGLILSCILIFIACIPWMLMLITQLSGFSKTDALSWAPKGTPLMVLGLFNVFNIGYTSNMFFYIVALIFFTPFVLLGIINLRRDLDNIIFLGIWIILPLLSVLFFSKFVPSFIYRYFIFCLPAYIILLARGIAVCNIKNLFVAICILIIGISTFFSLKNYYNDNYVLPEYFFRPGIHPSKDYKGVSSFLQANYLKGDLIGHASSCTFSPVGYYLGYELDHYEDKPANYLLHLSPYKGPYYSTITYFLEKVASQNMGLYQELKTYLRFDVQDIKSSTDRFWFVFADWEPEVYDESGFQIRKWLLEHFKIICYKQFKGIDVYLFDAKKVFLKN